MMIPEDNHLRFVPAFVSAEDRIRMEALLFATDLASLAFERIERTALAWPYADFDMPLPLQRHLLADAWTIVDQIHVCRQLFTPDARRNVGEPLGQWHSQTEAATLLRNGMDHVARNVGNLAKKQQPYPLFGGLTLMRSPDWQRYGAEPVAYGMVTLSAGAIGPTSYPVPIPKTANSELVSVHICAFDQMLDIATAVRQLREIMVAVSTTAQKDLHAQMIDQSIDHQELENARQQAPRVLMWGGVVNPTPPDGDVG